MKDKFFERIFSGLEIQKKSREKNNYFLARLFFEFFSILNFFFILKILINHRKFGLRILKIGLWIFDIEFIKQYQQSKIQNPKSKIQKIWQTQI